MMYKSPNRILDGFQNKAEGGMLCCRIYLMQPFYNDYKIKMSVYPQMKRTAIPSMT